MQFKDDFVYEIYKHIVYITSIQFSQYLYETLYETLYTMPREKKEKKTIIVREDEGIKDEQGYGCTNFYNEVCLGPEMLGEREN